MDQKWEGLRVINDKYKQMLNYVKTFNRKIIIDDTTISVKLFIFFNFRYQKLQQKEKNLFLIPIRSFLRDLSNLSIGERDKAIVTIELTQDISIL